MTGAELRDLIVSLTDSLAWPVFTVIILFMLRPYLSKLSPLIETIRYKGFELNFRRSVLDVADRAELLEAVDDSSVEVPLPEALDPDPRIAILKSWARVETAIEDLAKEHRQELGQGKRMSTRRRVEMLHKASLIDHSLASVLHDMGAVRNLIAHGEDIPLNDYTLREYLRAAAHVASIVEQHLDN